MAIQVQGASGAMLEVDGTTFRAMRVSIRPINYGYLGMYRRADTSGNMGAIGAAQELYQWRWTDNSSPGVFAILYYLGVSVGEQTAATTAALLSLSGIFSRSYTVAGTGGTRSGMVDDNGKLRAGMASSRLTDVAIPTNTQLTAGTQTLDVTPFGSVTYSTGTGATTTRVSGTILSASDGVLLDASREGDHPAVFTTNQGFVIVTGANVNPAGIVWSMAVNCGWAEAAAF